MTETTESNEIEIPSKESILPIRNPIMSMINWSNDLLDEICLEGLEGITLEQLWLRLTIRWNQDSIPDKIKPFLWERITYLKDVLMYALEKPRDTFPVVYKHRELAFWALEHFENLDNVNYKFCPVNGENGSCEFYNSRVNITNSARSVNYEEVVEKLGNKLVIVGSSEARWLCLAPTLSPSLRSIIKPPLYCYLERIGRSRHNGEATYGTKIITDSKTLFYYRKSLIDQGLVKKHQITDSRNSHTYSIVIHLTRFYRTYESTFIGKMSSLFALVDLLQKSGGVMSLAKALNFLRNVPEPLTLKQINKFLKHIPELQWNVPMKYEEIVSQLSEDDRIQKIDSNEFISVVKLKQEEESDDENDESGPSAKYHERMFYHGQSLLSQVYSCVREAGPNGLVAKEITKKMGTYPKLTMFICRILASYKLFHIVLVDEKRQRRARFIAQQFTKYDMVSVTKKVKPEKIKTESKKESKPDIGKLQLNKKKALSTLQQTRMNTILKYLEKERVMYLTVLPRLCTIEEKGLNGKVDRKSLKRIVNYLHDTKQLQIHRVKISETDTIVLLSTPDVKPDHNKFMSIIANREMNLAKLEKVPKSKPIEEIHAGLQKLDGKRNNLLLPKFWKSRDLHEYLFYIAYHHSYHKNVSEISSAVIENDEIINKFKNVPYLKVHENWPGGWIFFLDAISTIPLSYFVNIQPLLYFVPGLSEYIKDPVKKHTLVKDLPASIKSILLFKKRYVHRIFSVLELLVYMGLVKLGERTMKEREGLYIYVNKKATIFDTTSSDASYTVTEDREYPKIEFTFESVEDLDDYWSRLQQICLNTKLGFRNTAVGKLVSYTNVYEKLKYLLVSHSKIEAQQNDDGRIPGDGRGAGGLDSSLCSHMRKSWKFSANDTFDVKPVIVKNLPPVSVEQKVVRKPAGLPYFTRRMKVKTERVIKNKKRLVRPKYMPKRREVKEDNIDMEINKTFHNIRVKWTVEETQILLLFQVAFSLISPQRIIYFNALVRDILRIMTRIYNKTSKACARRLLFMTKTSRIVRSKQILLAEILSISSIKSRYYNIYTIRKVQQTSPKFDEFENDIKIYIIELFYILHRHVNGGKVHTTSLLLPNSYADLMQRFSMEVPVDQLQSRTFRLSQPTTLLEIGESVAHSVINSVLYCCNEKMYKQENLLDIYIKHPEEALRGAMTRLRKMGTISQKKSMKQFNPAYSVFNYHFSSSYIYHLCRDMSYTIFSNIYDHVTKLINSGEFGSFAGMMEIQSGTSATLIELLNLKMIRISLNIPSKISIINTKSKYKIENDLEDSNDAIENMSQFIRDFRVINACEFVTSINCSLDTVKETTTFETAWISKLILSDVLVNKEDMIGKCDEILNKQPIIYSIIYEFIKDAEELGVNAAKLKDRFSANIEVLDVLKTLTEEKLIYRVGYVTSCWISWEYATEWSVACTKLKADLKRKHENQEYPTAKRQRTSSNSMELNLETVSPNVNETELDNRNENTEKSDFRFFPRPWIRPNGTIGTRVIWRWVGSIVCHLTLKSSIKLTDLQQTFNHMTPFHMKILVEYSTMFGFTKMFALKQYPETLFTESRIELHEVDLLENDENIYVELLPGALLRFASMKAKALSELIESIP